MAKALRNLALLGGLGAAAMMMGKKKGESKEDTERDTREEAISGPLKDSKSTKATKAIGRAMMQGDKADKTAPSAAPTRRAADSGSVRTPGRDMPSASTLRPGAKAVVEKEPGDFDRMMEERRRERGASSSSGNMGDVIGAKKGGMIKSSASKRADGCAIKGKTRGRMV